MIQETPPQPQRPPLPLPQPGRYTHHDTAIWMDALVDDLRRRVDGRGYANPFTPDRLRVWRDIRAMLESCEEPEDTLLKRLAGPRTISRHWHLLLWGNRLQGDLLLELCEMTPLQAITAARLDEWPALRAHLLDCPLACGAARFWGVAPHD